MPRPRKCRRICRMPNATQYGPAGGSSQTITLSVDEFECIRLLYYEGLTQEQVDTFLALCDHIHNNLNPQKECAHAHDKNHPSPSQRV